jgi:hypothetical protein
LVVNWKKKLSQPAWRRLWAATLVTEGKGAPFIYGQRNSGLQAQTQQWLSLQKRRGGQTRVPTNTLQISLILLRQLPWGKLKNRLFGVTFFKPFLRQAVKHLTENTSWTFASLGSSYQGFKPKHMCTESCVNGGQRIARPSPQSSRT